MTIALEKFKDDPEGFGENMDAKLALSAMWRLLLETSPINESDAMVKMKITEIYFYLRARASKGEIQQCHSELIESLKRKGKA